MQPPETDTIEPTLGGPLGRFVDPDWYQARYPDIAGGGLDPIEHYIRYGAAEKRDPNPFFDSAWYVEHYPDVAASGIDPLLHYVQAGATELRNPHPRFDAVYYVEQHPEAAANPLLYHLGIGVARGYLMERPIEIGDYLPSGRSPLPVPLGVFADVVIVVQSDLAATQRCIRSVLADRAFPLGRIIVVDDRVPEPELAEWLGDLAAEGDIHLMRNRRRSGFGASVALGMEAAEGHDVVLLNGAAEVSAGWLRRLAAHAYSQTNIASVSPLCGDGPATPERMDEICRTINIGRSADVPATTDHCVYIRRAALLAAGGYGAAIGDFCADATEAGWEHRLACDTFVSGFAGSDERATPANALPFRFAVTAALFRESKLPVILMISHSLGGGARRHIDDLVDRYRDTAHVLLLEGTVRGAALSVAGPRGHPVVTLPADRLDDLVTVLRSANLSRIHIHHLLRMDLDIRVLVHRLGVPFDVTVHDYFAICPQINLLTWPEGFYCGEPGPGVCNACIASRSSHGARDIVSWRRDWAWQFLEADRVICPSADVRARLDRHRLGERAIVVPHEHATETVWTVRNPGLAGPVLRIAVLGVLANHKGARTVAEVAEAAERGTIEIHVIGYLEDDFPKQAAKLIKTTGRYRDRDLPALVKRIDPHVFWFASSWPETYSYTLSTAIATGLPIVATDLGSFPERLAGRPQAWLVDHRASARDWLAAFETVRAALRTHSDQPAVPRPLAPPDFYADRYLAPAPRASSARTARRPRIAIVPERYSTGGLTPCAYIRLLQPLDYQAAGGTFDIILADSETILSYDADIIVTQRYAIPDVETANRLAEHASRTGAKLVFDIDDDLLNIPNTHPDAPALRPFAQVVRRMLTVADAVWVSTTGLAESLASIRPDAMVIENRLDERIWIGGPVPNPLWDDPVRILCMGTTSHEHDFAMIEPALLRLKAEYGDRIAIDVLGMTGRSELPAGLNRIGPSTHASRSYPGFVNWLTSMRPRWHVGLAPLLDTPFNRGKSPIKAMDYAALGLAVLASGTPVYRGSIADGAGGQLVANDPRAWHAALDWLIRDHALRAATSVRAREAFLAGATLASDRETRSAALQDLLPDRTQGRKTGLRDAPATLRLQDAPPDPIARKRRSRS